MNTSDEQFMEAMRTNPLVRRAYDHGHWEFLLRSDPLIRRAYDMGQHDANQEFIEGMRELDRRLSLDGKIVTSIVRKGPSAE